MRSRVIRDKKVLAKVFFCGDDFSRAKTPEAILAEATRNIRDSRVIGYAGFSKKEYLTDYLLRQMFDSNDQNVRLSGLDPMRYAERVKVIERALRDAKKVLSSKRYTRIFVFPSFSAFTKEQMGGVSGYTPWEDTLLLFIDPTARSRKSLRDTILHEYVHSVSREHHLWKTLRDSIVFEGLAENFVYSISRGILSPWAASIPRERASKVFAEIRKNLSSTDVGLYRELFFKNEKYPLWAGYAIGYHLISAYRKKHPELGWDELVKKSTAEFVKTAIFL